MTPTQSKHHRYNTSEKGKARNLRWKRRNEALYRARRKEQRLAKAAE